MAPEGTALDDRAKLNDERGVTTAGKVLVGGIVIALVGCAPERPDARETAQRDRPGEERVVAEVAGEVVTLQEFRRRVDRLPTWGRARLGTVEARQNHLPALADFELLADEAERRGYADDPRVVATVKQTVAADELDRRVAAAATDEGDAAAARAAAERATLDALRKGAKIEVDEAAVQSVKAK